MFGKFFSSSSKFFNLFERNADVIVKASTELAKACAGETDIAQSAEKIRQLEHEADNITYQCVDELHKNFITPFERNDIYKLISKMDDVIDNINDAMRAITLYHLTEMTVHARDLSAIIMRASNDIVRSVQGLIRNEGIERLRPYFTKIHLMENEADEILRRAIGELFDQEQDIKKLIKWKEVYEHLENAVDSCEDVANIIEGVIIEIN
jgi:uncharacterized protein